MIVTEQVPAALAGERLDRVVALVTGCSRAEATRWVADGLVCLGDAVVTARSRHVQAGDVLTIDVPDRGDDRPVADPSVAFDVVHADDDVIVVDKPAGLVVHPGSGHPDGTLVNGLLARYPELAGVGEAHRPGIVHRLDRGTSGLLVVARSAAAYDRLVADLSAHEVLRRYRALVVGRPEPGRGLVDAPIGRSARFATRMTVSASGRPARTRYEVTDSFTSPLAVSLVDCELETGRTHQIRVHLAAIGHPVVGDTTYGGARAELGMDRPFLHALTLGFTHPTTGAAVEFTAPVPDELDAVVARLGH